ncbi:MAG: hypothetical protein M0T74_07850 [Desulfitobacterium hafniense]|nr:hypothetical protein [Desulfitobacterium hafniense]
MTLEKRVTQLEKEVAERREVAQPETKEIQEIAKRLYVRRNH